MADRTPSDSPMASDRIDRMYNAYKSGDHSWTEGLPHDFKGWGPQTPDPDEHVVDMRGGDEGLHWDGNEDGNSHIVWRFDRRTRH